VDSPKINHISLCTGYGGIDLGLRRVVPDLRTVAYCEIEAFVIANLVSKMEAGLLDAAPVWTNLKTFPFGKFRGLVDVLSGGYPCPPFSAAGKRKGKDDPRHLWPWIADGIRLCEPRFCFFENVEGHVSLGLSTVVSDLEELGYEVSWGIFSASEVGAPHQRKRVFILAARDGVADAERFRLQCSGLEPGKQKVSKPSDIGSGERKNVADGIREGLEGFGGPEHDGDEPGRIAQEEDGSTSKGRFCLWPARPGQQQFWWEPPRTTTDSRNRLEDAHRGADGRRGTHGYGPTEVGGESLQQERQAHGDRPEQADGDSGAESGGKEEFGQVEPEMGGDFDGRPDRLGHAELYFSCDNRTDELRLLGNGVVPATASKAFFNLLAELSSK